MAKSTRPQAPKFRTPKGVFRFPRLSEVDYGTKEFPKPEGEYSVTLILPANDERTQGFIEKLEPFYQKALANGEVAFKALKAESRRKLGGVKPNPLYTELLDPDTEEPTGDIAFKFAMRASGEYKKGPKSGQFWDSRPTIFDRTTAILAQGFSFRDREEEETMDMVHTKTKPSIWGGTTGYVSFEVGIDADGEPGYFIPGTGAAGLKLGLKAVQVIDVVSGGTKSASDYGFEKEEDEYGAGTVDGGAEEDTADF